MSDSRTDMPMEEYRDRRLWEWQRLEGGGAVIVGYNGEQSDIFVPERIDGHSVKVIGRLAKINGRNTAVRSVTLPDTVEEIARDAFGGMDVLEDVFLSKSLKYIGHSAFRECSRLVSVDFPDTLEEIDDCAFEGCTSLRSALLPDSLKILGDGAFCNCTSLEEVRVPESLEYMGRAFCDCKRLEDEDGFVIVGGVLYNYYGYQPEVVIPEGVKVIDDYVFSGNKRMMYVELPSTLIQIGRYAFDGAANLHSLTLPENLEKIGVCAFRDCRILESVNIPPRLYQLSECAFKGCYRLADREGFIVVGGVLFDYIGNRTDVTVPDWVVRISDDVFEGRSDITSVRLPPAVQGTSHYTFRGCKGLADKDGYIVVGGTLYDYIGEEAFLVIPEGVREIKDMAIPKDRVASVKLPESLQRVDGFTFSGCHRLADNNGFIVMNGVLYGYMGYSYDVNVPYGVKEINDDAFNSCKNIRSVSLPDTVKRIGNGAFYDCVRLERINLEQVAVIGYEAFRGCIRLKGVELAHGASVSDTAFTDCDAMADENGFVILNGVLYDYIPKELPETVTVPNSVKSVGEKLTDSRLLKVFPYGVPKRPEHPLWRCGLIRAKKGSCVLQLAREKGVAVEEA